MKLANIVSSTNAEPRWRNKFVLRITGNWRVWHPSSRVKTTFVTTKGNRVHAPVNWFDLDAVEVRAVALPDTREFSRMRWQGKREQQSDDAVSAHAGEF